ncbi:hypothetical protein F4859DRAFT_117496 [Xylaria cf. heliscus]|nr:hypothetical protein F4859DRAFT_117496 [Xylaria cf. heliscus]
MLRELEERRLWKEETDRKLESLEEMLRKKDTDIENLQSTLEQAGKEISPERMQEKERHEQERQALMEAVAMYEAQTWDDEGEDGLEELEDELKRKDLEIESMRFNLNQTAATKMRQDHDLVQAKRALTEEKDKFKGRLQRREDKIQSLKAEVDEKREKLRAERERTAKERKRGDEYRDKYYDMKARVDRRDQTISSLRGSGSGSGSSRKHRH